MTWTCTAMQAVRHTRVRHSMPGASLVSHKEIRAEEVEVSNTNGHEVSTETDDIAHHDENSRSVSRAEGDNISGFSTVSSGPLFHRSRTTLPHPSPDLQKNTLFKDRVFLKDRTFLEDRTLPKDNSPLKERPKVLNFLFRLPLPICLSSFSWRPFVPF